MSSLLTPVSDFFAFIGDLGLFGFRAIRRTFIPPYEFNETVTQIYDAGWRSLPLLIASGFAFGIIIALQTRAEMQSFGAGGMIPQAVSTGLFRDIGALIAALLVAGRRGRHDPYKEPVHGRRLGRDRSRHGRADRQLQRKPGPAVLAPQWHHL